MTTTATLTREDTDMSTTYGHQGHLALRERHTPTKPTKPAVGARWWVRWTRRTPSRRTNEHQVSRRADCLRASPSLAQQSPWADPMPADVAMLVLRSR